MLGISGAAGEGWSSDNLWKRYRETREVSVRNQLIERFLPIVKYHADRLHRRMPAQVDVDDLVSAGVFGLMDAIDSYDIEREVKFETYCGRRVAGAILDELRAQDWTPRLVRSRTARMDKARRGLAQRLGRTPTDDELAGAFNVEAEEYERIRRDARQVHLASLSHNRFHTDGDREVREMEFIEDDGKMDPVLAALREDVKQVLMRRFSRAERLVIVLYYYEKMTMREIGRTLDMSESRVSQLHTSIIARLKSRRGPDADGLAAVLAP